MSGDSREEKRERAMSFGHNQLLFPFDGNEKYVPESLRSPTYREKIFYFYNGPKRRYFVLL